MAKSTLGLFELVGFKGCALTLVVNDVIRVVRPHENELTATNDNKSIAAARIAGCYS